MLKLRARTGPVNVWGRGSGRIGEIEQHRSEVHCVGRNKVVADAVHGVVHGEPVVARVQMPVDALHEAVNVIHSTELLASNSISRLNPEVTGTDVPGRRR